MKYLLNPSTDPYYNMALDEYCLEHIRSDAPYFFLWRNAPSVIIGLNQNAYGEVNLPFLEENGIRLVRRMTGGGAVYHDLQNLNYTLIGAHPSPQPIVEALRTLGVAAELTGRNDIFVDGKKVSGYARRVSHGQEIIHGTLMYDVDLDTLIRVLDTPTSKMNAKGIASVRSRVGNLKGLLPDFPSLDALQARLQEMLAGGDGQITLSEEQEAQVQAAARQKFASWDFIYGHSREAGFVFREKLPCGTVEARIQVDKGRLTDVAFTGDYLFDAPSEELAEQLRGVRYTTEDLAACLREAGCERYFHDTDAERMARLLTGQSPTSA